jgi:LAGLIDADG DNA endonuclease family
MDTSLAYWFMDDGYFVPNGFYFCTDNFSRQDIAILQSVLKEKFDLDSGLHTYKNRIYIPILSKLIY